jgi:hypothetical protein
MRKRCLPTLMSLVLGLVVLCALGANAEQLAKSGAGTSHTGFKAMGTATEISAKRSYWSGVSWGVSFNDEGKGFLHNMAWNCPHVDETVEGRTTAKGWCTLTDADGDAIFSEWTGSRPPGGELTGHLGMTGGTGKYAGIQGEWDFRCQFIIPGQAYCQQKYTYKLP